MTQPMRIVSFDWRFSIFDCRLKKSAIGNRQSAIRKQQSTGLTFVELLMAATMFSILMVGVFSHLRAGVLAWRRTTSTIESLQRRRIAIDRLEHDLMNAVAIESDEDSDPPFPQAAFGSDHLAFFTVRPGPLGASSGYRVWFVDYQVSHDPEMAGLVSRVRTIREAQAEQAQAETSILDELLLADVEQLKIQYGYLDKGAIDWHDEWTDAKQLPRLMKLTLTFTAPSVKAGSKATTSAPLPIQRMIVIPPQQLKAYEPPGESGDIQQPPPQDPQDPPGDGGTPPDA